MTTDPRWITPTQAARLLGLRRAEDLRVWMVEHPEAAARVATRPRGASYWVDGTALAAAQRESENHKAQIANENEGGHEGTEARRHEGSASPPHPPQPLRGISLDQITTLSREELVVLAASAPSVTGLLDAQLERLKLLTEIKHKEQITQVKRGDLVKKSEASDSWTTALRLIRTELSRLGMNSASDIVQRSWPADEAVAEATRALLKLGTPEALAAARGLTRPAGLEDTIRQLIDRKVALALEAAREAIV